MEKKKLTDYKATEDKASKMDISGFPGLDRESRLNENDKDRKRRQAMGGVVAARIAPDDAGDWQEPEEFLSEGEKDAIAELMGTTREHEEKEIEEEYEQPQRRSRPAVEQDEEVSDSTISALSRKIFGK